MNLGKTLLCAAFGAALAGCASIPEGPSVRVMPAPGKPFDQFNEDNVICKEYARQQLGVDPNKVAEEKVLSGAAAGAAIGAVSGALIGGRGSAQGGAGVGVLFGSAAGADAANRSTMSLQRRYDIAYEQCMYAKGNQIPGFPAPRYMPPPPPPRS
jgi:hypothetical protein